MPDQPTDAERIVNSFYVSSNQEQIDSLHLKLLNIISDTNNYQLSNVLIGFASVLSVIIVAIMQEHGIHEDVMFEATLKIMRDAVKQRKQRYNAQTVSDNEPTLQ